MYRAPPTNLQLVILVCVFFFSVVVSGVVISQLIFSQEPEVIDFDGVTRDWDWLTGYFGDVQLSPGSGSASVHKVVAVSGPASLSIYVVDESDNPIEDVPVIFYWPDAPVLPIEYQHCGLTEGIWGGTDVSGKIGFAMGSGSYYFPPDGGPHTVWVGVDGTDCFSGFGMVGLTNHDHIDSYWRLGPEIEYDLFLPLIIKEV